MVFVAIVLRRAQKKIVESLALWVPPGIIKPISLFWFIRQNFCLFGGMLFLIIAAAGPLLSNHKASGLESRHGLVVIAFKNDGKSSPASIGLQAKLLSQIQKAHFQMEGARIGLMLYGGKSDLFCPLTLDPEFYEYVAWSSKRASVESANLAVLDGIVSLGEALGKAIETLQNQSLNSRQLTVVLYEDLGRGDAVRDALLHADIPKDVGLTLVFPEASEVPEALSVYCAGGNANAVALDSGIIPDDRVFEVLNKGDSNGVLFQDGASVFVAAPAWFAVPGLVCLLMAFIFPPNVLGLVSQLARHGNK